MDARELDDDIGWVLSERLVGGKERTAGKLCYAQSRDSCNQPTLRNAPPTCREDLAWFTMSQRVLDKRSSHADGEP